MGEMPNLTTLPTFLLLSFADNWKENVVYFTLLLVIYLAALGANFLIISAISLDQHLHKPMYFFLVNLSIVDLGCISVTIPNAMVNSLLNTREISYFGCVAQVCFLMLFLISDLFLGCISVTIPNAMVNSLLNTREISYFGCVAQVCFLMLFLISDLFLLTGMAYDRYVAICDPLHYETVMDRKACIQIAAGAWIGGLFYSALHTSSTFAITFCSNAINQFFCEIPQLLKISCNNLYLIEVGVIAFSVFIVFVCFCFIVTSYVQIFKSVLRIPTSQGRNKAFSTCLPHLIVVSLFTSTGSIAYMKPVSGSPSNLDLAFAVLYSVVPPLLNPVIYTMRNRDIKAALSKIFEYNISSRKQALFSTVSSFFRLVRLYFQNIRKGHSCGHS